MKSNSIKQIVLCIFILAIITIGAVWLKTEFFPDEGSSSNDPYTKDKYGYNEFQLINVTTETLIQRYFSDFKDKLITDPSQAYQLLERDTLTFFSTEEEFTSFIDERLSKIALTTIKGYTIQSNKSNTKYIVVDQYDNQYTFITTAVLVYKVEINYSSNF